MKEGNTTILKLKIGNMQKVNVIEKGLSTLRLEHQIINGIKKYFSNIKFDLILYSTPPITFCKAIQYLKERDKAATYLMLKDIFPQNAVDLGMIKKTGLGGVIYRYFRSKEKQLYEVSDYIGCMSDANVDFVIKHNRNIPVDTVEVCPNSIDPVDVIKNGDNLREKYGLPMNKTIFVYGGNLGKPQGIDFLIECIKLNECNNRSFILIVGSGTEYEKLEDYFNSNKIKNARLLKELPKQEYEVLINSCDVGMIFLDHRFTIPNFPSRLLSYMQAGMPVVAATDPNTDIKKDIIEGKFGFWCESKDPSEFNHLILKMLDNNHELMGQRAKDFLYDNYTSKHTYEVIMKHFK